MGVMGTICVAPVNAMGVGADVLRAVPQVLERAAGAVAVGAPARRWSM